MVQELHVSPPAAFVQLISRVSPVQRVGPSVHRTPLLLLHAIARRIISCERHLESPLRPPSTQSHCAEPTEGVRVQ